MISWYRPKYISANMVCYGLKPEQNPHPVIKMTWPWPAGIGRDLTAARTRAGLDAARRQDPDPDYIGVIISHFISDPGRSGK